MIKRVALQKAALSYDGYGGWRLPTAKEVSFLVVNHGFHAPVNFNEDGFLLAVRVGLPSVGSEKPKWKYWPTEDIGEKFWNNTLGIRWTGNENEQRFYRFIVQDTVKGLHTYDSYTEEPLVYRSDVNTLWPYSYSSLQPLDTMHGPPHPFKDVPEKIRTHSLVLVRQYDPDAKPHTIPPTKGIKNGDLAFCKSSSADKPIVSDKLYFIENGQKRHVVHSSALSHMAFSTIPDTTEVRCSILEELLDGPPIYTHGYHRHS